VTVTESWRHAIVIWRLGQRLLLREGAGDGHLLRGVEDIVRR
jgi:hypothetical protein